MTEQSDDYYKPAAKIDLIWVNFLSFWFNNFLKHSLIGNTSDSRNIKILNRNKREIQY
jgi:hypothetical protein